MLPRYLGRLLISGAVIRNIDVGRSEQLCPHCGIPFIAFRNKYKAAKPTPDKTTEANAQADFLEKPEKKSPRVNKTQQFLTSNQPLNVLIKAHRHQLTASRGLPKEMYLIFEVLADQIAKYMALANDDCIFMEGNPGLGLLTKLALDAGVQRLRVFEGNPVFLPRLQAIHKDSGAQRLDIVSPLNIFELSQRRVGKALLNKETSSPSLPLYPALTLSDTSEVVLPPPVNPPIPDKDAWEGKLERLISRGLPSRPWTDAKPAIKFFGIVPEKCGGLFFKRLVSCVAHQNLLCTAGRPELYLIVSPAIYHLLTTVPTPGGSFRFYRYVSVASQLIFHIECLEDIPRSKLAPPPSSKAINVPWKLIRMTARRDLGDVLDFSLFPEFLFFINQALTMRRKPLLAWLDGWIPGTARMMLDMGLTMYVRTGDLSAEQYVEIFRAIQSTPEYLGSTLKVAYKSGSLEIVFDPSESDDDDDTELQRKGVV